MRIAIISDIHEDFLNLQKTFDHILKLNINKIACLGDIVGFEVNHYKYEKTRSAQKCIQLIKQQSDVIVAGNHDLLAIERLPFFANQIGFPEDWYNLSMNELKHKYEHIFFLYKNEAENDLNEIDKDIIKNLNSWETLNNDALKILFSHFIYPDINGNIKTFTTNRDGFSQHFKWMEKLGVNLSFVGHAHIQGIGIATKKGLKINNFGIYSLKDEPQIILCPTIAESKYKNGFVIFDSDNMTLEVLRL